MPIKIPFDKKIKEELIKLNIEFSFDEDEIEIFNLENKIIFNNRDFYPENLINKETFYALLPAIDKKLYISDHFSLSMWDNNPDEKLYIVCYPEDTNSIIGLQRYIRNVKYSYNTLYYKDKSLENQHGQSDYVHISSFPEYFITIKDDKGETIALYSYNLILILFDIFHVHNSPLSSLHILFLKDLINNYLKIEPQLKELYYTYLESKSKIALIDFLKKDIEDTKNNLKNMIENAERVNESYLRTLTDNYKNIRKYELQMRGLESEKHNYEEMVDNLIKEYNIKFNTSGKMYIETEDIYIKDIYIGKFKIQMDVQHKTLKIYNLTNRIGQYDHPHIKEGNICLGDIASTISELIATNKYLDVASLCTELLYFYNPSTAYYPLSKWEEKMKKSKKDKTLVTVTEETLDEELTEDRLETTPAIEESHIEEVAEGEEIIS